MKRVLLVSLIVIAVVLGAVAVSADSAKAQPRPAILSFESSLESISVDEAEAGTATTTLSWATTGVSADYRVTLFAYKLDKWTLVFDPMGVPLEANGAREVTVQHSLTFSPPTYLLSIVKADSNSIIDQRVLTIPYAESADPVEVAVFAADVDQINAMDLQTGNARVTLSWEVAGRSPTSNLVFEQVFEDDSAVSVELPRPYLWIPSQGQGPVVPVYRADQADSVTLQLAVVDLISDEVLAEDTLTLEVSGEVPGPVPTPAPLPTTVPPVGNANIESFTVQPDLVNPGASVTLAWDVRGTSGITIEQRVPNVNASTVVVNAPQSPVGSAVVYLPEYAAYSVTYVLYTADRTESAEVTVNINCPYTFFFGQADGCPRGPVRDVGAVYQGFELGYMLWRSDTNEIYIHYDDGSAAYFLESTYAGLPEPALDEAPPLNRVAPVSGFGKVWANAPAVREKLGWALDAEQGYTMRSQEVANTRTPPPSVMFYITLPDGSVVGTGYGQWSTVE